jgi:ferrous iron transport protein A
MDIHLKEMNAGETGEVIGFYEGDGTYRRKLLSLGFTKGVTFNVIRVAPLGDPIEIEIRGFKLSLRKDEANILKVRRAS